MMIVYVLNTLIVPVDYTKYSSVVVKFERIPVEDVSKYLSRGFVSAVGHEGTARVLTALLGVNIPTNRVSVYMEPGDVGIHFFLRQRLPEGKVLTAEEMRGLDYWIVKSEVISQERGMEG